MAQEAYDWRFYLAAGLGLFLAQEVLDLLGVPPASASRAFLVAAFLAVLGALCLRNWRACGSRHCLVSGGGYALLALAALATAGGAPWSVDAVWLAFALVVALGVAVSLLEPEPSQA